MESETRRRSSSFSVIFTFTVLADRKLQFRRFDAVHRDLRDVDQALDTVGYRNKSSERDGLGDLVPSTTSPTSWSP